MGRHRGYRLPVLTFGGIWLLAVAFLAVRGEWRWVGAAVGAAAGLGAFVALTLWLTRGVVPSGDESTDSLRDASRRRLAAQLVVVLGMAGLAMFRFADIPIWSSVIRAAYRWGQGLPIPNANYLLNPVLYVLVPGALVLALGARWRGIGFQKGWRSWRVTAAWGAPVVAAWVWYVVSGQAGPGQILRAVVSNLFQNGFGEEFLWRGLVQTRIARLWTPEWGLVLASLAFGWWHLDSIPDWSGGDLWIAGALNVVIQAPMGLAMGVIFNRTRNLLAPTLVHVLANTVEV